MAGHDKAVRLRHFTGVDNSDKGSEGTPVITAPGPGGSEKARRESEGDKALTVWLQRGQARRSADLVLASDEYDQAMVMDAVNVCFPEEWDTILILTGGGSMVMEHPDRVALREAEEMSTYWELNPKT